MLFENTSLFTKPDGIETRWASPENFKAEKGKAGQSSGCRKGSPFFSLEAGESYVLAEEKEVSGTVYRIWVTVDDRDITMLRGLRFDFYWDGCECSGVNKKLI